MGYAMFEVKTKSATCLVPKLLASWGTWGCVLFASTHRNLEGFPLHASTLYGRVKLFHWRNGLQWTEVG